MKSVKFLFVLLLLTACNPEKVDTSGLKEEMEKYKIKKISQGEIMGQAAKTGSELFELFQVKTVNPGLDSALKGGSFENALPFCIYSSYPQKSELESRYKATISRAGYESRLRNPSNKPDSIQNLILEAYLYNQEKGLNYFNDVQILEQEILYNQPIILDQESCLKCHGNPEKEIGSENYQKIIAAYPSDKSVNFRKGELMGIFSVKLDKEELIRSIK